jgi:deoxyribodipyrimidine photolyase-related protein
LDLLIFPHQLFVSHPGFELQPDRIVLIEDSLFFGDAHYPLRFHKQKIWLHRATMKRFESHLQQQGYSTVYCDYSARPDSLRKHFKKLAQPRFVIADPVDFILRKRLSRISNDLDLEIEYLPTPGFINDAAENIAYRADKKRWFMADFYKWQRQRLNVLMDGTVPLGGKWSFDDDNRKKVPKKLLDTVPQIPILHHDEIDAEAKFYAEERFSLNPGTIEQLYYPTSHDAAGKWLSQFLHKKLGQFGTYEDAIVEGESWLWHSVLTPMLNTGLLTPRQILDETLAFADQNEVPLNSLEGFLRQIIGWREFIRATYEDLGVQMRTTNHWNHRRKLPPSFYDGTTGILPIDDTIKRILQTGYCHHIERLMVLGGFMFLCEFDPNDIYDWFMEMFIDSYDWVMVPNVYAMSQHADGGLITTKPYFSGSAYVRKMSHHKKADWCDTWDGLYWRWIWNHVDELAKNHRWAMMCSMAKKMDEEKRLTHIRNAEVFLSQIP